MAVQVPITPIRLYKLAQALQVTSGEIRRRCAEHVIILKNHMAMVDPQTARCIAVRFTGEDDDGDALAAE